MSPPSGICGACLFSVMTMLYLSPVNLHWPPTSGVFAMFLAANGGTLSEPKTTGPTTVSSLVAPMALASAVRRVARSFHRIERNFKQRMNETDRLGPLLAGCLLVAFGEVGSADAAQARFVGMAGRPPHLGRNVVAALAERLNGCREQQSLGNGHHLRPEAFLARLIPERRKVRRNDHAGDDLRVRASKRGNLRAKIVGQILKTARVGQLKALLGEHWRKADGRVAPGVAVGVIRKQGAHRFVGRDLTPHAGEDPDDIFEAPEVMECVVERLPALRVGGIGLPADEIGLPGSKARNAGNLFKLALRRHRVVGLGGCADQNQ